MKSRIESRSPMVSAVCSVAARIQDRDAAGHEEGGQRNVLGDDEVPGGGVLDDVPIGHVGAAVHPDRR